MQYCAQPGCSVLVNRGTCSKHRQTRDLHGTRTWYYSARWKRLRLRVCIEQAYACAECNQVTRSLEVDHIRKHEGDPLLFWDRANLQGLCTQCHTRKTRVGQ